MAIKLKISPQSDGAHAPKREHDGGATADSAPSLNSPAFQIAGQQPNAQGSTNRLRSPMVAGGVHQNPPLLGNGEGLGQAANVMEQPIGQSNSEPVSHQNQQPSQNSQDSRTNTKQAKAEPSPVASIFDGFHDKVSSFSRANIIRNKDVIAAEQRAKRLLMIFSLLMVIAAIAATYIFVPNVARIADSTANNLWDHVQEKLPTSLRSTPAPLPQSTEIKDATANESCRGVIAAALTTQRTRELSFAERIEVADCFLMTDSYPNLETMLRPIRTKLERLSDADIAAPSADRALGPGLQLLVLAALKRGAYADVDAILRNRCRTWKASPSCAAKIYSNSIRSYSASAFEGTKRIAAVKQSPIDPHSEAILKIGMGMSYAWQSMYRQADASFHAATRTKNASLGIKKFAYEAWATNLYLRGESNGVRAIVKRAHRDLTSIDNAAKNKLRLIANLSSPQTNKKAVQDFLRRQEISYRYKTDLSVIDMIGPGAIRWRFGQDLLTFVESSRRQIQRQSSSPSPLLQALIVWESRALLSTGKLAEARQRLQAHRAVLSDSHAAHHIRGSVNLGLAKTTTDFVAAANDFQTAMKHGKSWDSLYGETLALFRAGRISLAKLNYQKLAKEARTKAEKTWLRYLDIEMLIVKRDFQAAANALKQLDSETPLSDSFIRLRLQANLWAGMGDSVKAEEFEAKITDLNRTVGFINSSDQLSSPLGPLGLLAR